MSLKILFMGTPEFAVPVLKSLSESEHKILSVYTQPPKKKFRGQKVIETPVHILSKKLNYEVRCPKNLSNDNEYDFIKKLSPNVVVVVAYGQIIPEKILNIPNILFLNVHASLLPKWRGAAPIQRSIMEMDEETGVSIMKIIKKLDAGPYLLQEKIKLKKNENSESLAFRLSKIGSKLIVKALKLISSGDAIFNEQEEAKSTYAKKINKNECKINWDISAKQLIAKINGLSPFPGAWFEHNKNRIKIVEATEVDVNGKIGEVLDNNLLIGCKKHSIQILRIQKEGKKILKTNDFLKGYEILKGEVLN